MSTMLPFTSVDLLFATLVVGGLVVLSLVVYALARAQRPAQRIVLLAPVEAEAPAAAPAQTQTAGAVQPA